jgi:microcystin-dependent protein
MDEGTIGEIRGFAGNFCPMYWADCNGAQLGVMQNQALYSIVGTIYGGNQTVFNLPDLRGRVPVGFGQGSGLSEYWNLGEQGGTETNTLTIQNMPSHNHQAITSSMTVTGTATGTITPKCFSDEGGLNTAAGNVLGTGSGIYAGAADADADMAPINASLTLNGTVAGAVAIQNNGSGTPYSNMQPSLAIRWIICTQGMYPMRD